MLAGEFCGLIARELESAPPPFLSGWWTFQDRGFTYSRHGILMQVPSGGHLAAQVMSIGAQEPQEVGPAPEPHPAPHLTDRPPTLVQDVEAWLAWRVSADGGGRVRSVRRYSDSDDLGDYRMQHGLEVRFHGGSPDWRVLVVFPFLLRPGEGPHRGNAFRCAASV